MNIFRHDINWCNFKFIQFLNFSKYNKKKRRGWDSNPRKVLPLTDFRDPHLKPLGHLSEYFYYNTKLYSATGHAHQITFIAGRLNSSFNPNAVLVQSNLDNRYKQKQVGHTCQTIKLNTNQMNIRYCVKGLLIYYLDNG